MLKFANWFKMLTNLAITKLRYISFSATNYIFDRVRSCMCDLKYCSLEVDPWTSSSFFLNWERSLFAAFRATSIFSSVSPGLIIKKHSSSFLTKSRSTIISSRVNEVHFLEFITQLLKRVDLVITSVPVNLRATRDLKATFSLKLLLTYCIFNFCLRFK